MEEFKAIKRQKTSVHSARKERRKGYVPGIMYGKNLKSFMFEIAELELNKGINANGEHGLIDIDIDGEHHKGLIKEVQRDVVTHKIMHLDVEEFTGNKEIVSDVPLVFMGEDFVVKNGGVLQKDKNSIKVQCMAENLPKYITVDVGNLFRGDSYRIRDVELAQEITILDSVDTIIATVTKGNTNTKDTEAESNEEANSMVSGE